MPSVASSLSLMNTDNFPLWFNGIMLFFWGAFTIGCFYLIIRDRN